MMNREHVSLADGTGIDRQTGERIPWTAVVYETPNTIARLQLDGNGNILRSVNCEVVAVLPKRLAELETIFSQIVQPEIHSEWWENKRKLREWRIEGEAPGRFPAPAWQS